jgi:Zn-finger nucleic acid-binding protein
MKCPIDKLEFTKSSAKGIVLNECPKCHGVWLRRQAIEQIAKTRDMHLDQTEKGSLVGGMIVDLLGEALLSAGDLLKR